MSNRADESGLDGDQRQRIHGLNPPTPDRVTSDKQGPDEPTGASSILSLQQKAGNAAVADLLERRLEPVQRAPTTAVEVKPGADVTPAAGHPQLSGGSGGPLQRGAEPATPPLHRSPARAQARFAPGGGDLQHRGLPSPAGGAGRSHQLLPGGDGDARGTFRPTRERGRKPAPGPARAALPDSR